MSYSFDELAVLKVGDKIYECEMGMNIESIVTVAPEVKNDGLDGKRVVRWTGKSTQGEQREIAYMGTEGLLHYGPRIYAQPEYGYFDKTKNEWITPLTP